MESYLEEWEMVLPWRMTALSRQHPDVTFDIRPVGFRWMVRCTGSPAALDSLLTSAGPHLSLLWVDRAIEPLVAFAYVPGPKEVRLLRTVGSSGGLVLPPLRVREGRAHVRVLSSPGRSPYRGRDGGQLARLVARRRLAGPKLREEIDRLIPGRVGLTSQQTRVLLEAVRAGYYEVPRRATVRDVAVRLALGRSTAEEHLRAAESAIVSRAAPLIELSEEDGPDAVGPPQHVAGFSSELELYVDLALRGDRVTNVRLLPVPPPQNGRPDHPVLRQVLRHLRTGREDLSDLPVELHVSPFERRVLEEVRRIPPGETRSYGEIARRIGHAGAYRAVGNAVARNPVPLVIPCHRVLPERGGIGNYSAAGGARTKRRLLMRERAIPVSENDPPSPPSARSADTVPRRTRNPRKRTNLSSARSVSARRRASR